MFKPIEICQGEALKFIDEDPDVPAQINIVPAIDVIFAILAFFIISSLFLSRNEVLPVNLPKAESSQTQDQGEIVVTVTSEGQILVGESEVELDELKPRITQLMTEANSNVVEFKADESISYGQGIAVLDRLRQIENVRLAIRTTSKSNTEDSANE